MSAKTAAIETAGVTVAPELVVPLELAKALSAMRTRRKLTPESTVVIPPREVEPFLRFGKDRIRVRQRKGLRMVTVERAKGMTAGEVLLTIVVAGLAAGAYVAYRDVEGFEGWLTSTFKPPSLPSSSSVWKDVEKFFTTP